MHRRQKGVVVGHPPDKGYFIQGEDYGVYHAPNHAHYTFAVDDEVIIFLMFI